MPAAALDPPTVSADERVDLTGRQGAALALVALLTIVPNTLPVAVLRGLVYDRFGVSEFATSWFMSINMIGAVLAAPWAGALADRLGRVRGIVVAAILADAVCFLALTADVPFAVFMGIRLVEGVANITALSLLLAIAAGGAAPAERGRIMGMVGGGITLGVAIGAPLGGILGRTDPQRPLLVGAGVLVTAALLAAWLVVEKGHAGRRAGIGSILAVVKQRPAMVVPLAFAFVDRFTVGFFTTTFSLFAKRIHDLDAPAIGALLAAFLVPFALLSYPFGRLSERRSRRAMMVGGSAVYGVGVMFVGTWPPSSLGVLMLLLGLSSAVMFVPSLVMAGEVAGDEARGLAMGGFNAAGSLGFIVGPIVGGAVSEGVAATSGWATGYTWAFVVAGLSELVVVGLTWKPLGKLVAAGRTS